MKLKIQRKVLMYRRTLVDPVTKKEARWTEYIAEMMIEGDAPTEEDAPDYRFYMNLGTYSTFDDAERRLLNEPISIDIEEVTT